MLEKICTNKYNITLQTNRSLVNLRVRQNLKLARDLIAKINDPNFKGILMQKNMKKVWSSIALSLVALTSSVSADVDSAQMRNLENRVNALEQRRGASGMINPPGRPQIRDGADLFVLGELLVWNAHQNGMPIAVVTKGSPDNLANSNVRSIHSHWNAGFRLGLGYNLPHDGWDVSLLWARLHTHGSKRIHSKTNRFIHASLAHPTDTQIFGQAGRKASSTWRLHFNQLDLDLGREFFVSKWLTIRPHFGLRTDWICQKWNTSYKGHGIVVGNDTVKVKYHDQWWGLGLEGGLDTQWGLGSGWSLFGNLSTAIIYGFHELETKQKDSVPQNNTTPEGVAVDMDNTYRISHPILDLMMGLRYDHMFCNDCFHLGIDLGWEHHIYFSQNQFPRFVDDVSRGDIISNQGDLTFQGWTLAVRFDF